MSKALTRNQGRKRRQKRVRRKISGTPERPRLNVFRSLKNINVQVIDDSKGHTLVAASTLDPAIKDKLDSTSNCEAANVVGKVLAERCKEKGIVEVVFDRSGYQYHGRVKALADGAREAGLKF